MKQKWIGLAFAGALALIAAGRPATAHAACSDPGETFVTSVSRTFSNGAQWTFNVYRRACEGLTLNQVAYKAPGGIANIILHTATLSEVHVPYHTGSPRFLDVTASTSGLGVGAVILSAAECDGTLFDGGRICVANEDGGFGWKYGTQFRTQQAVQVFMSSQLGEYNYINTWTFHDDGTIEPAIGLTGRLQDFGNTSAYAPYGSRLNAESAATPFIGKSHMHNFYYRLDFDIGGSSSDAVARMSYVPSTAPSPNSTCTVAGTCGITTYNQLVTETSNTWAAASQNSWLVYDKLQMNAEGRKIGYELSPKVGGVWRGQTTGGEPWSSADLWVTSYNGCERYAALNQAPQLAGCAGAATNLSTMVSGQSIDGQDIVVWYVQRVNHVPRDEDYPNMPIEWTSFELKPRNFHHQNP